MTQTIHTRHVLELYSGDFIDYHNPSPDNIHIEDIARSLSYTARFGGHTNRFYSVAEHALLVTRLVEKVDPALALAALHHDSHEAYLGDLPTPLKTMVGEPYRVMAGDFDLSIAEAFGFSYVHLHSEVVKWADAAALRLEAYHLKASRGYHPEWDKSWEKWGLQDVPRELLPVSLSPAEAEYQFRKRHVTLLAGSQGS